MIPSACRVLPGLFSSCECNGYQTAPFVASPGTHPCSSSVFASVPAVREGKGIHKVNSAKNTLGYSKQGRGSTHIASDYSVRGYPCRTI